MEPLVSRTESLLANGGLLAVIAALFLRWAVHFALYRNNGVLESQLIAAAMLIAALNVAALYLPRSLAAVPQFFGALGWIYGLSLIPRYFFLWKTGARPHWELFAAAVLFIASVLLRWIMRRKWTAEISGKGWAWIDNWAKPRSLGARVLARQALVALGYRRAREKEL